MYCSPAFLSLFFQKLVYHRQDIISHTTQKLKLSVHVTSDKEQRSGPSIRPTQKQTRYLEFFSVQLL
jgi:hypothetical protein